MVSKFEQLASGAITIKLSDRSSNFSGLGGRLQVNSLVLEIQALRFANLEFYPRTYVRRSKVTESSCRAISKQVDDSSKRSMGVSYINQETPL